jgi:hypothetical protein
LDPNGREYLGAVAGMADTYGIPKSHIWQDNGRAYVFWVDDKGHLKHGPVLAATDEHVVAAFTKGSAALIPRQNLKAVPRFFGGAGE